MASLIVDIDRTRGGSNLASACRLSALEYYRMQADPNFKGSSEQPGQATA